MIPQSIQRRVTAERICVLTFDRPGSGANYFDPATVDQFGRELDFITSEPSLRGLVIAGAKPAVFIAGADLHFFAGRRPDSELRDYLEMGQSRIQRLANLPIPVVAAIHGACLGGGYELCLACGLRLASNARATKIGLPETTLGLLPAWGGTTRLPRLIGLEPALDLILTGKALDASHALAAGLVDELVAPEQLVETACQRILSGEFRKREHVPKPTPSPEAVRQIAQSRREAIERKTWGHNAAALKALEVAVAAVEGSLETSFARERDAFMELVRTESTQNRLRYFFLQDRARKTGRERAPLPPIKNLAVIGAGTMGSGIAFWASSRGLSVALGDVNEVARARGLARVAQLYDDGLRHGTFSAEEARAGRERVTAESDDAAVAGAELAIEAVVEDLAVKQNVFAHLDDVVPATALLATNTSALSVSEIAARTRRPERVVGLHFFNPVHRMPLVEVIAGRNTVPATLQRACRFVLQLGKLPVLVKDSPGFIVNRVLMPYLLEAVRLLAGGAPCEMIDEAMLDFGMAMGPLRVLDEIGLDVVLHIAETLERHVGQRAAPPAALRRLCEAGRLGRKTGAGLYRYDAGPGSTPVAAPEADVGISDTESRPAARLSREELQQRMLLLMVNEAARCLEEAVVAEPDDIDFALMAGAGFGTFRGGPLRYADSVGAGRLVDDLESLAEREGGRFAPCARLRAAAAHRQRFYA